MKLKLEISKPQLGWAGSLLMPFPPLPHLPISHPLPSFLLSTFLSSCLLLIFLLTPLFSPILLHREVYMFAKISKNFMH